MKKINNSLKTLTAGVAICLGFLISGCSDNFTSPSPASGSTIMQVASTNDSLSAYVAAATRAGLNTNLGNVNGGVFTVFAPSNYAFVKYLRFLGYKIGHVTPTTAGDSAKHVLNDIKKLNFLTSPLSITGANGTKNLVSILNYHTISSQLLSSAFSNKQVFTTLNNARLSMSKTGATTYVLNANEYIASSKTWFGANVIGVDFTASNGVVHIIDEVITPISTTGSSNSSLAYIGYNSTNNVNPIGYGATISYNLFISSTDANPNNYNLLCAAVRVTGVALTLFPNSTPLPDYTLFAPKDSVLLASYGWADETTALTAINGLSESTTPKLSDFTTAIKRLVVSGRILTTDLANGQSLTDLNGTTIPITFQSGKIYLKTPSGTNDVWIKTADGLTNAGIVHGTNGLLQ